MAYLFSNSIDLQLPVTPNVSDKETYAALQIVYNALRQLHAGLDAFFDVPTKQFTSSHTLDITDRGHGLDVTSNIVIPPDTSIPFNLGTTIVVTNIGAGNISIQRGSGVTLILAGTAVNSNKTLVPYGVASIRYLGSNVWIATGVGIT